MTWVTENGRIAWSIAIIKTTKKKSSDSVNHLVTVVKIARHWQNILLMFQGLTCMPLFRMCSALPCRWRWWPAWDALLAFASHEPTSLSNSESSSPNCNISIPICGDTALIELNYFPNETMFDFYQAWVCDWGKDLRQFNHTHMTATENGLILSSSTH